MHILRNEKFQFIPIHVSESSKYSDEPPELSYGNQTNMPTLILDQPSCDNLSEGYVKLSSQRVVDDRQMR